MEKLLNNRIVRIVIGTAIGVPVTAISIILGLHGLILLYAGIKEVEVLPFSLGVVTITGFVGIVGAWKRLFTSSEDMTEKQKTNTRTLLVFGLLSSLALSIWAMSSSEPEMAAILFMLSFGAGVFIYATPKTR